MLFPVQWFLTMDEIGRLKKIKHCKELTEENVFLV